MEQIQDIVLELEDENNRTIASDPGIQKSMKIVEDFLKSHPVMCYGGTAINNLLPVKDRFTNPRRMFQTMIFLVKLLKSIQSYFQIN